MTDWLEQCKIKIAPEDKVTGKARWESDWNCLLSVKRQGKKMSAFHSRHWFQLSLSHIDWVSWKKKSTFLPTNPQAPYTIVWRLSFLSFLLPFTSMDWHGSCVRSGGSARPLKQKCKKPAAVFLPFISREGTKSQGWKRQNPFYLSSLIYHQSPDHLQQSPDSHFLSLS